MTINEYLTNPYGSGTSVGGVGLQRNVLINEFETLKRSIKFRAYTVSDNIVAHVRIPSRKSDRVLYDVIIEFPNAMKINDAFLKDFELRVFSNCPSFVYTYANMFHRQGYLCDWLYMKYSKEVRNTPPSTRNVYNIIGFERSVFLALYFLQKSGYLNTRILRSVTNKGTQSQIKSLVKSDTEIQEEYKKAMTELHRTKKESTVQSKPYGTPKKQGIPKTTKTSKTMPVTSVTKVQHTNRTKSVKHI